VKAIRVHHFGEPDVLVIEELPDPRPGPGEAIVRIEAASVNPGDAKNVAGAMSQTTLPRTPGQDYAGVVEDGPGEWIGADVWGSGDGGFTRDGTHAQKAIVPVGSLRRKPAALSFDQAGSVGVTYLAAWCGLMNAARLDRSDAVVIIGAGGGVGGAAAQIAKRVGARVIGVDRTQPDPESAITRVADELVIGASNGPDEVRRATSGHGASVVFDAVGGVMFQTAPACLGRRGRLIEISATGQREVTFDLFDFYHNEGRILGVDTLQFGPEDAARVLDELQSAFETGDYRPAPVARTFPLSDATRAYQAVLSGGQGRIVLRPQE